MYTEHHQRNPLPKLLSICVLLLLFILVINALRLFEKDTIQPSTAKVDVTDIPPKSNLSETKTIPEETLPSDVNQVRQKPVAAETRETSKTRKTLPKSIRDIDTLDKRRWPDGFQLHRYWWVGHAAVYVAEMDRNSENLEFDVELANTQIIGRETITGTTRRLRQKGLQPFAGVNGSFGIRSDSYGRGGMMFNLYIEDGELISIPILLDRWGYSPPSPWGETSFGITSDGEYLLDAVQLNGKLSVGEDTLKIDAINQICDSLSPVVLFTPRFGRTTLTRRCYEFTLKELKLPLTGKYSSRFEVTAVNPRGSSIIPSDGVVLAIESRLGSKWYRKIGKSTKGEITIALTPEKWQTIQNGIGGNLRLLRDGKIEPELVKFNQTGGRSAHSHSNGAHRHPRSALGFNDDKLFLIVVDGRKPGYSSGMNLYQMADFLNDLGIEHAINFDGGSSSALWALGNIVNRPAHDYERRIFNVAMIRKRE